MFERLWKPPRTTIEDLVRDHYDDVFRFCARRAEPASAADLTQETFLEAHRSLRGFRGDSAARTWLLGIALNRCRHWARQKKATAFRIELRDDLAPIMSVESQLLDRKDLQRGLDSLSEEHREAVWLCVVEQLTTNEASAILGVPQGTVKSRLHYAFAHLRKLLTESEVSA